METQQITETPQLTPTQPVSAALSVRAQLDTFLLQGQTDASGFFSVAHGLAGPGSAPLAGYRIRTVSVIVEHQNGNWHTLEQSNAVDNRFWITPAAVQGRVASPLFANRRVQIVVFAQYIVG